MNASFAARCGATPSKNSEHNTMKKAASPLFHGACLLATSLAAQAHEGHHQAGAAHWHATDVFGFVALALVVGAAAWWIGRK
jgi:hypothetical protein